MAQALDAVAALHRRGGFIAGVNPDMIRLTDEDGHERIVMSTAGIRVRAGRAGDDARAGTARPGSERAGAAVRRARDSDGTRARRARRCLHDGRAGLPDGHRTTAVSRRIVARTAWPDAADHAGATRGPWPRCRGAASDAILRALAGDPAARFESASATSPTRSGESTRRAGRDARRDALTSPGICTILEPPLGLRVRGAIACRSCRSTFRPIFRCRARRSCSRDACGRSAARTRARRSVGSAAPATTK